MSQNRLLLLIATLLLIVAVGWFVGRQSGVIAFGKGPCADDKLKFCKDVARSGIKDCLRQHAAELSEACKVKLEAKAKAKNATQP